MKMRKKPRLRNIGQYATFEKYVLTQSIRVSWRANRLSGISKKSVNWPLLLVAPPLPIVSEAGGGFK